MSSLQRLLVQGGMRRVLLASNHSLYNISPASLTAAQQACLVRS
jgi:hypothetical protein